MKCVITGTETDYKWRGYPIKREFIDLAKLMENEQNFKDCTMRERVIILQNRWKDRVKEEATKEEIKDLPFIDKMFLKILGRK